MLRYYYSDPDSSTKIKTFTDKRLLKKISQRLNGNLTSCNNLCQIDIRVLALLYPSSLDQDPDTLSFGYINKIKFNSEYYELDSQLLEEILLHVDASHHRIFKEYNLD